MSKFVTITCDGCGTQKAESLYAVNEVGNEALGITCINWDQTMHYCPDCWKKMLAAIPDTK